MRLALAAVAALALAVAGCGGVEREPNLAQAAENTEATGSFAFEMTTRASDGESFSVTCEGVVDNLRKLARVACDGDGAFGSFETVIVGGSSYQRHRGEKKWTKEPAVEENPLNELSPSQILELLRSASSRTERVGEGQVRGEPTVRYALTVDCEKAELYDCDGETAVVDVWIGEDGLVRRIRADQIGMPFDLQFFDFGVPVEVQAPSPDQVVERPEPAAPGPCHVGEAGPIGVEQAMDALRRHGFEVERTPGAMCGPGIAAELETRPPNPPDGQLWCQVFADGTGLSSTGSVIGAETRSLENLTCHLIVEGSPADAVDRLDAAFAELKREAGG